MMRLQIVFATVILLLPLRATAQSIDPTFNGLARIIHCNMSTTVVCAGPEACVIASNSGFGPDANMWISLVERRAAPQSPITGPSSVPIEILSASPAAINSNLYVKFAFPKNDKANSSGMLIFFAKSNGGYDVRYGQTAEIKNPSGSPPLTHITTGGSCTIQNR